ncbi:MAG: hypothetical protein FWG83_00860 [Oscillospiraceae bacterium]|nr:hypothetical protein [Oscillospiraceae bacterium]
MATINNMISGNISSLGAIRNASQEQARELKNQYKSEEIDSKEYREKMTALKDREVDARNMAISAGINAANNASGLFGYLNHGGNFGGNQGIWGSGVFSGADSAVFIGARSELSTLQALNSARIGIENRARTLVGEIGRDRARGMDVSDRQEALSNLTGNLDILNKNLSGSIDKALATGNKDGKFVDVVGRIRDSLADKKVAAVDSDEDGDDEASVAEKIAKNAKSEYAESTNILNDEEVESANTTPESALEMGVTPANA